MSDTDWIKELKPGDEVIVVTERHPYRQLAHITSNKNGIIEIIGRKFYKSKGWVSPDKWNAAFITPATSKSKSEIIHNQLICKTADMIYDFERGNKLSYSQAVRILEILNEKEQPKE